MTLQKLTILGSTGSIGVNTLDVVRRHPERYRVIALCAHNQIDRLFEQCLEFQPRFAVVRDAELAAELQRRLRSVSYTHILWPEFDSTAFAAAISSYQQRERRFGRTSEQLIRGPLSVVNADHSPENAGLVRPANLKINA